MKQEMETLTSSRTNDWCTPPHIIAHAAGVLGAIDLDPASNHVANTHIVRAYNYYDELDNGLSKEWRGTIWLNPPYNKIGNQSSAGVWGEKLLHEYQSGRVIAAIMLTKTVPGYDWWDRFFHGDWPGSICILRGRLSFIHLSWIAADGTISVPPNISNKSKAASTLWYVGPDIDVFYNVFHKLGRVI